MKQTRIKGGFILLTHFRTNSLPWRELSTDACWAYCELLKKKRAGKAEDDEKLPAEEREELSLTYREAKSKMGQRRFHNALTQLVEKGFIQTKKKRVPRELRRRKSIFVISPNWKEGDPASARRDKEEFRRKQYADFYKPWGNLAGSSSHNPPSSAFKTLSLGNTISNTLGKVNTVETSRFPNNIQNEHC